MALTVYLDTSFIVALALPNDRCHDDARQIQSLLDELNATVLISAPVLLEIGNYFSRLNTRQLAVNFFKTIEYNKHFKIIPFTDTILDKSLQLYASRSDKEWSLVDCTSFIIMQEFKTKIALTADRHFEQAGFIPALLNPDSIAS